MTKPVDTVAALVSMWKTTICGDIGRPPLGGVAGAVDVPDLGGWAGTPALNPEGER
ncbi:MAG: hypothetical protein WA880_02435 [Ornithinimicrobium sp.]